MAEYPVNRTSPFLFLSFNMSAEQKFANYIWPVTYQERHNQLNLKPPKKIIAGKQWYRY